MIIIIAIIIDANDDTLTTSVGPASTVYTHKISILVSLKADTHNVPQRADQSINQSISQSFLKLQERMGQRSRWMDRLCDAVKSAKLVVLVVQRFGEGLVIERSLVRLPAGVLSSQLGQLSLPSLRGR